jgi:hypothetical protein
MVMAALHACDGASAWAGETCRLHNARSQGFPEGERSSARNNNLTPLIIVSALATAVAFVLVPLLGLDRQAKRIVSSE